jgi:hypothetical protein
MYIHAQWTEIISIIKPLNGASYGQFSCGYLSHTHAYISTHQFTKHNENIIIHPEKLHTHTLTPTQLFPGNKMLVSKQKLYHQAKVIVSHSKSNSYNSLKIKISIIILTMNGSEHAFLHRCNEFYRMPCCAQYIVGENKAIWNIVFSKKWFKN